ncbi:GTPase, partial [Pseudokineococcus marinus]|uniref:GTPase n=1 Tax=Pseudokineococcus marinus TaxID=351215 RepID=UPI001FE757CD
RVVVDATAGTTRDPVDEVVELAGREWVFVDTAGIRRRVHQSSVAAGTGLVTCLPGGGPVGRPRGPSPRGAARAPESWAGGPHRPRRRG